MVKYMYDSPQQIYEISCHVHHLSNKNIQKRRLIKEVHRLMQLDGDYAGFYYASGHARAARARRAEYERERETSASFQ